MRPRIGQLIPWTIALCLAGDAGSRLIPLDLFAFRAWEVLVVGRGPTGPFEPNRVYVSPLATGDLSRPARFTRLRRHHLEYFSTDAWGFRNTAAAAVDGPVRWLLVGDSFGVSSGTRDAGTLASQLARWSGLPVYNGSSYDPLPIGDIRFTRRRLGMNDGVVIYEYMERQELPQGSTFPETRIFTDGPPPASRSIAERYRVWKKDVAVSRLSILAGWAWDAMTARAEPSTRDSAPQAAGELPTAAYELTNGATMLFYTGDVEVTRNPNRVIAPDYLIWLRSQLAPLGLRLAVLIAPAKYQVYGPLVKDPSALRPSDAALDRLADALKANGIPAVNVTGALRREAADGLARGEYVYFLDDTHWNERGIEVAAKAFVDEIQNPRTSPRLARQK